MGYASRRKRRRRPSGTDLTEVEIRQLYKWLAAGVMNDPMQHAAALCEGKTAFRNNLSKAFREMRLTCRDFIAKSERVQASKQILALMDRFGNDTALEYAWHIFSGIGWRNTLICVSSQLGFQLPWNTTPDMILRYLMINEPASDENPIMTVRSNLDDRKHAQTWEGSARERTGTYEEIMRSSKLPAIERGLAAGTHELQDELGRKIVPGEMREKAERAAADKGA